MSVKRIERQLEAFEQAAAELLADTHFWQRKRRRKIEANLAQARRQAASYVAHDRKRATKRQLRGITGGKR